MNKNIKYFAYGSNLDQDHLDKLGVNIINVEKGILKDWKLVFNVIHGGISGAGYANVVPTDGSIVEGAIIETDQKSIKLLDEYEAYPLLYNKVHLQVSKEDGSTLQALLYTGNIIQDGLKPTKEHLRKVLNGKRFLSSGYYERLLEVETVD